jgi:hypothetical protein
LIRCKGGRDFPPFFVLYNNNIYNRYMLREDLKILKDERYDTDVAYYYDLISDIVKGSFTSGVYTLCFSQIKDMDDINIYNYFVYDNGDDRVIYINEDIKKLLKEDGLSVDFNNGCVTISINKFEE